MNHRLLVLTLSVWVSWGSNASAGPLRAGAAMSNITPDMGVVLDGPIMKIGPVKHVHDELHVRCLVLDDGRTQIAFAICDVTVMATEIVVEAKEILGKSTGIPPENVLIAATHTHSAPRAINVGFGPANDACRLL